MFYLLTEWLRGGNQEVDSRPLETKQEPVVFVERGGNQEHDSRPLTWRTLITGLLEEVKILEEHFVAAWTSVAERPERGTPLMNIHPRMLVSSPDHTPRILRERVW